MTGEKQAPTSTWRGMHKAAQQYFVAARRKIAIAHYELDSLTRSLEGDLPMEAPVRVQANFEGVVHAFCSVVDQFLHALNLGRKQLSDLPDSGCLGDAHRWLSDKVVRDATDARNEATHSYYDKRRFDDVWHVISIEHGRNDDRGDIASFARRAVDHLDGILPILDFIEQEIVEGSYR